MALAVVVEYLFGPVSSQERSTSSPENKHVKFVIKVEIGIDIEETILSLSQTSDSPPILSEKFEVTERWGLSDVWLGIVVRTCADEDISACAVVPKYQ
jgi:hypothetical protein